MQPSILLEIGHGLLSPKGYDPGSVYHSKISEHELNRVLAFRLQKRLRELGLRCDVIDVVADLYSIGKKRAGYTVFHSVHHNASAAGKAQGTEVCVHHTKATADDRRLAILLAHAASAELGIDVRYGNGVNDLRALGVLSGACDAKRPARAGEQADVAVLSEAYFGDALALGKHVDWSERAADAYAKAYAAYFGIRSSSQLARAG